METNHEDGWVNERLAALEPRWTPDFAHGRQLLDAGLAKHTRPRAWIAALAVAAMCLAAVALPHTRALAQELWQRLVLHRVDVIRLDLSDLPVRAKLTMNGMQQPLTGLDDAERKAGFRPWLPEAGVLPSNPSLSMTPRMAVEQTIHVSEMEAALRKVGAGGMAVPPEWEGVQLRAGIGPMVAADYPGEVQILQARPIELSVPTGFPLERFAEVAFRSIGVSVWEARALARKFVANPAWLLDIPPDEPVNIQEVSLRSGPALLMEDFDDRGKLARVTVIRSTSERILAVMANSRQLAIRVADSIP
jgi:hypothetical protein